MLFPHVGRLVCIPRANQTGLKVGAASLLVVRGSISSVSAGASIGCITEKRWEGRTCA
jgi:hypothetical protein